MKKLITLALASSMMLVSSLSYSQGGVIAGKTVGKAKPAAKLAVMKAKAPGKAGAKK